jgi:hypothetical protein
LATVVAGAADGLAVEMGVLLCATTELTIKKSASSATATSSSVTVRAVANFFCIIYLPSSRNDDSSA